MNMTENAAQQLREEYLSQLDAAMRGLPHGVATDIRAGIDEELQGLDASATAERIARLGDPAEIARGAQEETPGGQAFAPPPVVAPTTPRGPVSATKGFAITAALALGFGGFLVPVLGWFIGVVLVSLSALWKTWEKVVAILVPFVVTGLSFLAASAFTGFSSGASGGSSSGTGPEVEAANPLVPGIGEWHVLILLGFLLVPASGLWLLWRLRGRAAR
jgi:uncharacterized membrane protein